MEQKTGNKPKYIGNGIDVWENIAKNGKPYLKIRMTVGRNETSCTKINLPLAFLNDGVKKDALSEQTPTA
jgi:hypothetical protein